jgi:hypothetical protein
VFLRALYGLPMTEDERVVFAHHTGRTTPRPGGYPEAVAVVGRQSGKSQVAAAVAVFEALRCPVPRDGSTVHALLIAQDARGVARTLLAYASAILSRVPLFAPLIASEKQDTITLASGVCVSAYPCRPQGVRGVRACIAIADELAFFRSSDGYPTDTEMLRALRPSLLTTGGRLLVLSSPYTSAGALYGLYQRHWAKDSETLIWQGRSDEMHPTLDPLWLERLRQDDPEGYISEIEAQFRTGTTVLFDLDSLAASVDRGVRERLPVPGTVSHGFVDAAGGSGSDAFTASVAHADGDLIIIDGLRVWKPPFDPSVIISECAAWLKTYACHEVTGDRYAGGFVPEQFRMHGLVYRPSEMDRSALYLATVPLLNAGRIRLTDNADLMREMQGLERRRGSNGRDRVDHRMGHHDDRSNVVCGAATLVRARAAKPMQQVNILSGQQVATEWSGCRFTPWS